MRGAGWPGFKIPVHAIGSHPQPFLRKTVENKKRSFKLDAAISLHRAHARCERCHSASRAIRAIRGRPTPVVAPCAAWGDRFATVSWDDCGRPKFEFSQRQPLHKASRRSHQQTDATGTRLGRRRWRTVPSIPTGNAKKVFNQATLTRVLKR